MDCQAANIPPSSAGYCIPHIIQVYAVRSIKHQPFPHPKKQQLCGLTGSQPHRSSLQKDASLDGNMDASRAVHHSD